MFNNKKGKDDPAIAFNQRPIPPPYVAAPAAAQGVRTQPYVNSPATRGLTPISLPGSRSHTSNVGSAMSTTEPTTVESKKTEKKKEKKVKKEKMERQQSIEAVLVSPSSAGGKKNKKKKNKKSDVVIFPGTNAITTPPPFLFPSGTMTLPDVLFPEKSKNWKLSDKLSKGCRVVDHLDGPELTRHRELRIPVESSEIVVYVSAKKDGEGGILAMHMENNSLADMSISRNHRSAILTRGSLQLKKPSFSVSQCVVYFKGKESPNMNVSLFDLRGIHVDDSGSNAVVVAYEKQREHDSIIRYAVYQTPDTSRFILPLAKSVVAAYTGVPQWAIPISWSGDLPPLPTIPKYEYKAWMGKDGGYSSTLYAASLAYHVKEKLNYESFRLGTEKISAEIMKQQETRRPSFQAASFGPQKIKVLTLAVALGDGYQGSVKTGLVSALTLAGLNALSFNLVFRKLELARARFDRKDRERLLKYKNALGRALLYNVTLREVDFEMTNLCEFGETIGNAWALNAQPLISRVNFSGCQLTGDDFHGLLRGLSRIWCGGTALAEVIKMARNPDIPFAAWDAFFRVLVDPSTLSSWPQSPPPPPNLSFLQELDVRRTKAVGPGLVEIAAKLTGLRTLKVSSAGGTTLASDVLRTLQMAKAPLETFEFEGEDPHIAEALFQHKTLKEITFIGFIGDGRPLLSDWPQPMPKLKLSIGKDYVPKSHPSTNPSYSGHSPGTIVLGNSNNFCIGAMETLANRAVGLKKLVVYDTYYWQLAGAAFGLADGGLEIIHIYPPTNNEKNQGTSRETKKLVGKINSIGLSKIEGFWETLARSKTLREIQVPDQMLGGMYSYEVGMVGRFLKTNRSVRKIGFDHRFLILTVENVKILRSAFYGNKKVIRMEYLTKAKQATLKDFREKTNNELNKIKGYKHEIKMLFKRAYSKYNYRWRDGPNRDKLPWIEKIRVAKREIGRLNREQTKIATLLDEIVNCIKNNNRTNSAIEEQKASERLTRRAGQLSNLATKEKKFKTDLVTKLRKAKIRGRQQNSAKMQVPRSTYYKSRNVWPSHARKSNRRRRRRRRYKHRFYDPYYSRYDWGSSDSSDSSDSECSSDTETNCKWLESCVEDVPVTNDDPWANIDSLVQELDGDCNCALDPEYLADIHQECCELGVDVLNDVSSTLDIGAAVANKLDEIGVSTNASNEMLTAFYDSSLGEQFDLAAIERDLPDAEDYDNFGDDMVDAMDADEAVGMYAGAGPRDLDDGGPSFGGSGHAARSGARRRATARKKRRAMNRIREKANRRLKTGYRNLSIVGTSPKLGTYNEDSEWPDNIVSSWVAEARFEQIKAMAESDLFDLPEVSGKSHSLLTEWSYNSNDQYERHANIEVVLVTQCSIDRLPNLQAQLASWTGKASVTVYLQLTEDRASAVDAILCAIKKAKASSGSKNFDVAVTIVEGCAEDESYPINYLRNVALLEARRQHLRFNSSLDNSASLLVDVDFSPSHNLHAMLHSKQSEKSILKGGKVVVCPAFESITKVCPTTIPALKQQMSNGQAEGFHQSHFPQGHGPTRFDTFWEKSISSLDTTIENDEDYLWNESYGVSYEDLYEPYIVMASAEVPLYDERFQGYGLNKVSHLASVAKRNGEFLVLPGVFLVAPAHERSEAWGKIYGGSRSEDKKFNQLALKGLYYNFKKNLEDGKNPIVCENTRSKQEHLVQQERESKQKLDESNQSVQIHNLA
eukprot:CAMPEP_0116146926 /NCGR_PEP_ID=MMETSP0329-20121206/17445_1 /TAXON_ID=697910 /ORGANISM="Pseudo-nitzschia arenysensis, Strain B593" /LENGTH=1715 /DNA_ID=CAMNT_0003642747 /DNA_START=204 /DNA_END=5348 /DNA_ORIENTATION=-